MGEKYRANPGISLKTWKGEWNKKKKKFCTDKLITAIDARAIHWLPKN